jgi:hypothetical protein
VTDRATGTPPSLVWDELTSLSDTYTCYSSAIAAWAALGSASWASAINGGLHLVVVDAGDALFGFSHLAPELSRTLGLVRRTADDVAEAVAGINAELAANGRVIVAGDGFNLPWHVAYGRRHVPHWFVLSANGAVSVVDPFTCRNDLGIQQATLEPLDQADLPALVAGVPVDDPVFALREAFGLGADERPLPAASFRWFAHAAAPDPPSPLGDAGPAAVRRLATHFREHGLDRAAYRQADDLWSIARHRAFFAQQVAGEAAKRGSGDLQAWVEDHVLPLARRWAHVAPLLMQATLALDGGRTPTTSLPDTLDELADREENAYTPIAAHAPELVQPRLIVSS